MTYLEPRLKTIYVAVHQRYRPSGYHYAVHLPVRQTGRISQYICLHS